MEIIPLSHTLAAIEPAIPRGLVSDRALGRVCAVVQRLPAALTSTVYLECRLAADVSSVDVILEIDTQGRDIIAGKIPAIPAPEAVHHSQAWSRVARLCQRWADPKSELHDSIERIWLEFDLDSRDETQENNEVDDTGANEGATRTPVPGLFVDFLRKSTGRQGSRRDDLDLALAIMDEVSPGHTPRWNEHPVRRCFDLLPAQSWVPYVGVFPARRSDAIRFCVRDLAPEQRLEYLRAVGWEGVDRLEASMHSITGHWGDNEYRQGAVLHLDVGSSDIGPTLGLEYYLERLPQLRGELAEESFLDHLTQLGLCSQSKRRDLLAWPGYEIKRLSHELWPSLVSRRVNHVKLVHDHRRFIEAKAYLCVTHRYHERAPAKDRQPLV